MNKIFLYLFTITLSVNLFSCTLIAAMAELHDFSVRDKEDDVRGNIHVYIENKSNETVLVNLVYLDRSGEKNGRSMEFARVSKSEIKMINIRKGATISVSGGNTRKEYLETVCNSDYETIVIY
jgi:hypothetical protein